MNQTFWGIFWAMLTSGIGGGWQQRLMDAPSCPERDTQGHCVPTYYP